jgi:hypothetical protein
LLREHRALTCWFWWHRGFRCGGVRRDPIVFLPTSPGLPRTTCYKYSRPPMIVRDARRRPSSGSAEPPLPCVNPFQKCLSLSCAVAAREGALRRRA